MSADENQRRTERTSGTGDAALPAPSRVAPSSAIDLGRVENGRISFAN